MSTTVHKLELVRAPAARAVPRDPTLRIAIASQDGKGLNAHFGFARWLMVYDVTARGHRLAQILRFAPEVTDGGEEEDRIRPKIRALAGCHVLYVLAIGPPAAAKVIQANIHPIKVGAPEATEVVIARARAMMAVDPPRWLRRILLENQND